MGGVELKTAFLETGPGKILRYFFTGVGSPVVFLHGAADSPKTFLPQAEKLAGAHFCLLPYLPGHGRSFRLVPATGLADISQAVAALLTAQRLPAVALLGYSFGAAVAVDLALRHPHLVNRLIILDGLILKHPLPFPRVISAITADYLRDTAKALARGVAVKALTAERLSAHLAGYGLIHRLAGAVDFTDRLNEVKVPTLILWGKDDHVIPIADAYRLKEGIKGSKLRLFPGGHTWKRAYPEALTRALETFLREG